MILQQLQAEQITALKSKEMLKLQTIRGIISQIKNKEIDKHAPLTEEECLEVIKKIKKEYTESIESFTKGGRTDLLDEVKKQLAIVMAYLPAEISDAELESSVRSILEKNTALIAQNPKTAIGLCMKELRGKADSSRILSALKRIQSV